MIERQTPFEGYAMHCDFCSDYEEFDTEDFQQMITDAKELGWKMLKVDNEWAHKCPSCVESESGERWK